jgi:4-hydroxybenzoate polyprenyltransferase
MNVIVSFKRAVRWESWAQGKLPLFTSIMCYLILVNSASTSRALVDFILFLLFSILSSIYGYLVNDLFDIKIDCAHGKQNVFESAGFLKGSIAVLTVLLLSITAGVRFADKMWFVPLWVLWIFIASVYSARPIRLKERGTLGLFAAFMSQYPIPILLCFSAFNRFGTWDMWAVLLFATVSGAALEIGHQRHDMHRDASTNTKTFAVRHAGRGMDKLYGVFLYADMLSVLGMMTTMAITLAGTGMSFLPVNIMLVPIVIHVVLASFSLQLMHRSGTALADPYYIAGRRDILNITFVLFTNFFFPFYLTCVLLLVDLRYAALGCLFLIITYINYPGASISWPVRIFLREVRNVFSK